MIWLATRGSCIVGSRFASPTQQRTYADTTPQLIDLSVFSVSSRLDDFRSGLSVPVRFFFFFFFSTRFAKNLSTKTLLAELCTWLLWLVVQ